MDLTSAFSITWPVLLVCAVAIAAIAWTLKASAATLRRSIDQLHGSQALLTTKLGEMDRQLSDVGTRQTDLVDRLAKSERMLQQQSAAESSASTKAAGNDAEAFEVPAESLQRFEAASQALAQLAQELGGFDARQAENWQRIKGDLEEQSFHLQRVQQHVDRLFTGSTPEQNYTPVAANAA